MSTAPRCAPRLPARRAIDVADLDLSPNLHDVDDVYARLLTLHDGRTLEDSFRIAARLNLILINHIGDRTVIDAACALAERKPPR